MLLLGNGTRSRLPIRRGSAAPTMHAVIPVERALEIVLAEASALGCEEVSLADSLGRVLREDVSSDIQMPPFDRAAMDGYAVRAADVREAPRTLPVAVLIKAGDPPGFELPAGHAAQIMTGAPVPPAADAVIPVEQTERLGEGVRFSSPPPQGAHVAPRGSEVRPGDCVLEAGRLVDAAAIAVLATVGRARVSVGKRPSVAVLVTGDELVPVTARPRGGQIRNSNGPALEALARSCGATVTRLGVAADRADALADAMRPGLEADILVVSGGVSAGEFDLVEDVFSSFGVEVFFDQVAIKPGKPLVFGRRGGTLVFGLPGNPVSAMVTFEVFVRSALLELQGARTPGRPLLQAELLGPLKNRSKRRAHLPVVLRAAGAGLVADPIRSRGSADVVAHARATGLAVLEADQRDAAAGERVPVRVLPGFSIDGT